MIELILYQVSNYIKSKNYTEYFLKKTITVVWNGLGIWFCLSYTLPLHARWIMWTCNMISVTCQHDYFACWHIHIAYQHTVDKKEVAYYWLIDWIVFYAALQYLNHVTTCHMLIYTTCSNTLSCLYYLSNGIQAKSCSFNHLFWKYSRL